MKKKYKVTYYYSDSTETIKVEVEIDGVLMESNIKEVAHLKTDPTKVNEYKYSHSEIEYLGPEYGVLDAQYLGYVRDEDYYYYRIVKLPNEEKVADVLDFEDAVKMVELLNKRG